MDEIKSFIEENFQEFIDWLDKRGFEEPEEYAEACITELEEELK